MIIKALLKIICKMFEFVNKTGANPSFSTKFKLLKEGLYL